MAAAVADSDALAGQTLSSAELDLALQAVTNVPAGRPVVSDEVTSMNQLKVNQQQTIVALHAQGWSKRRIARELGLGRLTLRRYRAAAGAKSPANPRIGSEAGRSNSPTPQTGCLSTFGSGPDSLCAPWKAQIEGALAVGLSVQRFYQDLVGKGQFVGSYDSVWRFVRRLEGVAVLTSRRLEAEPGAELQVDFGRGAWFVENGQRHRPHLFRSVLSCCRKGYSEVVWGRTLALALGDV